MNRLGFAIFLLVSLPQLCRAESKSDVKYSDLVPAVTATLHRHQVTLHVGSDLENSAFYTRVKTKLSGQTLTVTGRRTLLKQSREIEIPLADSIDSGRLTIEWINPDGSKTPVPIKK